MNINKYKFKRAFLYSLLPCSIFFSHQVFAGGADDYCEFDLTLTSDEYSICNNLPVLAPVNDNKTNMYLLLSDSGLAQIDNLKPPSTTLWNIESGIVPFHGNELSSLVKNKVPNQRAKYNYDSSSYYDEHCISLDLGKTDFTQQVQKNKNIPSTEKQILISERNKLKECNNEKLPLLSVDPNWSVATRQYASYLNATLSFYNTNYSTAHKIYTVLTAVDDPWLKETSHYMLIRTSLNEAYATGKDTYGDLDFSTLNQPLLSNFQNHISTYLKLYPHGQYTASARGFMRRSYWLNQQQDKLIDEIVWQINNSKSPYFNLNFAVLPEEIDRKIFDKSINPKLFKDPFFLSTYDLMYMRKSSDTKYHPITWQQLSAQKDVFKTQPELFKYLQATHLFYVQNKPQEALQYLPKSQNDLNSYLTLSQAFLKGQILEKTNKVQAEQYWMQLLKLAKNIYPKGLFETALSNHLNQKQDINAFLGKNPLISQIYLQKHFILNVANEKSLEQFIQSNQSTSDQKQAALYTLLSKSLEAQNYKLFNQYYSSLPSNSSEYKSYDSSDKFKENPPFSNFIWNGTTITPQLTCPNLITLTQKLEKSPNNQLLNICLGEYARTSNNGFPDYWRYYGNKPASTFIGSTFARGNTYKDIIKNGPKGDLQAYALYRAVMCYSPSGANDCGDAEVNKSIRKEWFNQLKNEYPNTTWAKSLKYYW